MSNMWFEIHVMLSVNEQAIVSEYCASIQEPVGYHQWGMIRGGLNQKQLHKWRFGESLKQNTKKKAENKVSKNDLCLSSIPLILQE